MTGFMILFILLAGLVGLLRLYDFLVRPDRAHQNSELITQIDKLLPQTQCGQCHYDGCRPYATAIVSGEAGIDQCPPGGKQTILAIANLLGREINKPINLPQQDPVPILARIDEDLCIGCVKCIRACPVDAIIGAPRQMHTVIAPYCTGCELCIPPCPVNCITMVPAKNQTPTPILERPEKVSNEMPCIGCGDCVSVCPVNLMPQALFRDIKKDDFLSSRARNLLDCTECDECTNVCPSHIPLLDHFKYAKSQIVLENHQRQAADLARERMQKCNQRNLDSTRRKYAKDVNDKPADNKNLDDKLTYIQEAISRTLKKRAGNSPNNNDAI